VSDELDQAIASLEDYLRRYPSGNFAELAQTRLDRLLARRGEKRIVPVSPPTPLSQGIVLPDPNWRVGDWYELRITDGLTRRVREGRRTVTAVSDLQVAFNDGILILDPIGNAIRGDDGKGFVDNQHFPNEYVVGKRWTTRYGVTTPQGNDTITLSYVIKAREKITVPAGTFDAFRGEGTGWAGRGGTREFRWWAAPDKVRRFIKHEQFWRDPGNRTLRDHVYELVAFKETR
jgi:hypothetical protein